MVGHLREGAMMEASKIAESLIESLYEVQVCEYTGSEICYLRLQVSLAIDCPVQRVVVIDLSHCGVV